jgi:hypothetical protein
MPYNWKPPKWTSVRSGLLFFGGLAGVFHQEVLTNTSRPELLILFGAMMGLPAFLNNKDKDEK